MTKSRPITEEYGFGPNIGEGGRAQTDVSDHAHHPHMGITSSGGERYGETGVSGVSGWGLTPPASTLRGKEGDIITKRHQRGHTPSRGVS